MLMVILLRRGGAQVLSGFGPESVMDKSRHNISVLTEFDAYLTENWNIVFANRYDDYSDFGDTLTSKLASPKTFLFVVL
jgi:iron complex outermembrane receptor protein